MQTGRFHHIFDLAQCDPETITNTEKIRVFLDEMMQAIDMRLLAGPIITEGIPENPGITALVAVDFSHISIHTFTAGRSEALIDIFSCKPYDKDVALEVCLKYFGKPETIVRHKEVFWG